MELWRAVFGGAAAPGYLIIFGDRFLLAYLAGPETVGVYAAMAAATVSLVNVFGAAVNRVLEPALYAETGSGTDLGRVARGSGMIYGTTVGILLAALPIVLVYALVPESIISVFTSAAYADSAEYLWVLLTASLMYLAGQQLMLRGLVVKRPWLYVPVRFIHSGALVTGFLLFVPVYGIAGAVFSMLVGHALWLVLVGLTNRYRVPTTAQL